MGIPTYSVQRSFSGGELDPSLHARADLARYVQGARALTNFFVRKSGGISNRMGFQFLGQVRNSSDLTRIYPWTFTAASQSVLIEVGNGYMRFWHNGALLQVDDSSVPAWSGSDAYVQGDLVSVSGAFYYATVDNSGADPTDASADEWYALPGTIYEIPTPYASGAFNSPGPLRFAQSGAIITITHPGYARYELQNLDTLGTQPRWVLVLASTAPGIDPPPSDTDLEGAPSGSGMGTFTYRYVVTAVAAETYEESIASAVITVSGTDQPTEAAPIVLGWTAVLGAAEYRVYLDPFGNGTFGYLGVATDQESFNDVGFAPDFTRTPPVDRDPFSGTYDKPEMSCIYQQRSIYGYTDNNPAGIEASRVGFRNNFTLSSPIQDDDALSFTVASNDNNVLRHLVPLDPLVLLTESGPIAFRGDADGVIRPDAINLKALGEGGASRAPVAIVGNAVIYAHRSQHIPLVFAHESADGPAGVEDLSLMAAHLFEGRRIVKFVYHKDPHSIVWCLMSDGVLLGLTYLPKENVWAWHKHTTGAGDVIEDLCVLPDDYGDSLYVLVARTIGSDTARYIERMLPREGLTAANRNEAAAFVDSHITFWSAGTTTLTGLNHLEGREVAVIVDGEVVSNGHGGGYTVSSGQVEIPAAGDIVHVGLPIDYPEFESLSLDVEGSNVRGKRKRVQGITAVVDRSVQGFWAGRRDTELTQHVAPPWQDAGDLVSQACEMSIRASWDDEGRFLIRHTEPTPLTILALLPYIDIGG